MSLPLRFGSIPPSRLGGYRRAPFHVSCRSRNSNNEQIEHDEGELPAILDNIAVDEIEKGRQYRSEHLFIPQRARGVFGGQTFSQATRAALHTIDPAYQVNSLTAIFTRAGLLTSDIDYHVSPVTNGRAFASRRVSAQQEDKVLLELLASFQRPEEGPAVDNMPFPDPLSLPDPEAAGPAAGHLLSILCPPEHSKPIYVNSLELRSADPFKLPDQAHPRLQPTYTWFRPRQIPKNLDDGSKAAYLAYLSDRDFLPNASYALGIGKFTSPRKLGMLVTLNHTVHYWNYDFDPSDWVLYQKRLEAASSGRCLVRGAMYNPRGTLLATTLQEGCFRTSIVN